MAKDRLTPCVYYECIGVCSKNREANHNGYCQKCDKYVPRAKEKHRNMKKDKLDKIRKSENLEE